jgi:hypothetical protein
MSLRAGSYSAERLREADAAADFGEHAEDLLYGDGFSAEQRGYSLLGKGRQTDELLVEVEPCFQMAKPGAV